MQDAEPVTPDDPPCLSNLLNPSEVSNPEDIRDDPW
jgi:hypothetical protein